MMFMCVRYLCVLRLQLRKVDPLLCPSQMSLRAHARVVLIIEQLDIKLGPALD